MNIKKIIITGATGAVGSAVARRALSNDMDVTCIVHKGSHRLSNLKTFKNCNIVECDLCDYGSLCLNDDYDAFIHLAWEKTFGNSRDDADVQMRNIQHTLDACHLANRSGCTVFVGAGSQAEYGVQLQNLSPFTPVNPESGYGIAKYAAGKLSALLCRSLGMRQNWVRILSVYGPNDGPNTLISYIISELKAGHSPQLTKCEQIWDYVYADDAADAILAIADKGIDGKAYPLGNGRGRKLSEFAKDIRNIIDPNVAINFGAKEYYPHQPMYLVADISELSKDTGWLPKYTFIEGIKKLM